MFSYMPLSLSFLSFSPLSNTGLLFLASSFFTIDSTLVCIFSNKISLIAPSVGCDPSQGFLGLRWFGNPSQECEFMNMSI